MRTRRRPLLAILPALAAILIALWLQRTTPPATPAATPAGPSTGVAVPSTPAAPPTAEPASRQGTPASTAKPADSALTKIAPEEREEVEKTLALIEKGGPFPHRKDGSVFSNRERRLPSQPGGYYREYTVETPGSPDRGARRIIRGSAGETYYTRDHYGTFVRIDERPSSS
jgi:ribonuclease T1